MKLKIDRNSDWKKINVDFQNTYTKKDQDFFSLDYVDIVILGNVYHTEMVKWMTSKDIYELYKLLDTNLHEKIDGIFTIIILDKKKKKAIIIIDPYKIYSCYYLIENNNIIISDTLRTIIDNSSFRLNETALLEFLHFGYLLGNKTISENINKFDGGSIYIIDSNCDISHEYYFNFQKKETTSYSKDDFLEGFNSNVKKGIALSKKISLPLTAGLDSRVILSAALESKDKLHCYTHGMKNSIDVNVARKICKLLVVEHEFYNLSNKSFQKNIMNIASELSLKFEGMQNSILFSHLSYSYKNEAKYANTFFPGIGGELLRKYFLPKNSYDIETLEDFANAIRKKIQLSRDCYLYKKFSEKDVINILNSSILKELKKANSNNYIFMSEYFYLKNRIGNFASFGIRYIGESFKVFLPFLSKQLLMITPNLDIKVKSNMFLQKYIIQKNCKQLTEVPINYFYSITENNTIIDLKIKCRKNIYYFMKIINKFVKYPLFQIDSTYYYEWLEKYHKNYIKNFFKISDSIINSNKMGELINLAINKKKHNNLYIVTNILSLLFFLKKMK